MSKTLLLLRMASYLGFLLGYAPAMLNAALPSCNELYQKCAAQKSCEVFPKGKWGYQICEGASPYPFLRTKFEWEQACKCAAQGSTTDCDNPADSARSHGECL